jgi:bifunctional non-homologous end joining protein LigD
VLTRAMLSELGLKSWLKTTGGKGLHVVVPIEPEVDYDTAKAFTQAVVHHMARTIPQRFVSVPGPARRKQRIFIDFLRNGQSQSTAAAFSARARPGLPVSMPIMWEQLPDVKSGAEWNITNALPHLQQLKVDPWSGYWKARQSLIRASSRLVPLSRTWYCSRGQFYGAETSFGIGVFPPGSLMSWPVTLL